MYWILFAVLWFTGLIWDGIIFGQNNILPSLITITIALLPIVNILFAIAKTIADYKNGKYYDEMNKIKMLFKEDEQDE